MTNASPQEHYDHHLGHFYDWMVGDFTIQQQHQQEFFESNGILPTDNRQAVDLGAGHGLQSISLAQLGFAVTALDFNRTLLNQLTARKSSLAIKTVQANLLDFPKHVSEASVIVCMGDTIAHLDSFKEIEQLIKQCYDTLLPAGKLILSFRDYHIALESVHRFIPVKSDDNRILTCILDYTDDRVLVTDQLYEKLGNDWIQKVSTYQKLRITVPLIQKHLTQAGFRLTNHDTLNRMHYLIAEKAHL